MDWIRDHISLISIFDNSSRQLENFRILVTINQYRLNYFNRLQHFNEYLTPEELFELNSINLDELLVFQRALVTLLNDLNNNIINNINRGNSNTPFF